MFIIHARREWAHIVVDRIVHIVKLVAINDIHKRRTQEGKEERKRKRETARAGEGEKEPKREREPKRDRERERIRTRVCIWNRSSKNRLGS